MRKLARSAYRAMKAFVVRKLIFSIAKNVAINIDSHVGMFATLNWIVSIEIFCKSRGINVRFSAGGPLYVEKSKGKDWLAYFLMQNCKKNAMYFPLAIRHIDELGIDPGAELTEIEKVNVAWHSKFDFNREFSERIDSYCLEWGINECLGVHYRGTDKYLEAPRQAYEKHWNVAKKIARECGIDRIFVSSDEVGYLEYARDCSDEFEVFWRSDSVRSNCDGGAAHFIKSDNYEKAKDALVNVVLLSRCKMLVKSPSIFSGWSKVLNPKIEVVMVGKMDAKHNYFPDCILQLNPNTII